MHIVIAGCGRVGSELARWLADDGHDVVIIDKNQAALDRMGKSFNGAVYRGEAFDVEVLEQAGIRDAEVFLAVTNSDNANLMAVAVVRSVFGLERAIARLYDPVREESYRGLGIKFITGTKLIATVFYEQVIDEEFTFHVTFTEGDVEIVEFTLNDEADGMTIADLEIRHKLRIAAVQREDFTHIPSRRFELRSGDLVVAAAREGVKKRVERFLKEERP